MKVPEVSGGAPLRNAASPVPPHGINNDVTWPVIDTVDHEFISDSELKTQL